MQKNTKRKIVLVSGVSGTGKSMSLRNLPDHEGVLYLNCEIGKDLPFAHNFLVETITDPDEVPQAIYEAESYSHIHTIVVDSLTFLMEMYRLQRVNNSANTQKAWGEYGDFFRKLMMQCVTASTKNIVFIAHTATITDDEGREKGVYVKVAGNLMNNGIESFFSYVVSTKKMKINDLKNYRQPLLNIDEYEKNLGYKYCFQTMANKDTVNERMRGAHHMWKIDETFIDNDIMHVLNRIDEYHDTP